MDKPNRWRRIALRLLVLLFVITIIVIVFINRERIDELKQYGYLGAFLISLILNATIILPVGNFLVIASLGFALPLPWLVGLVAGIGAGIGEMTGYLTGYSGRGVIENSRLYERFVGWLKRWGAVAIFSLSVVPFAFDLVGIAAGVLRYPWWKFLIFCALGRCLLYIIMAYAGALGWEWVLSWFNSGAG